MKKFKRRNFALVLIGVSFFVAASYSAYAATSTTVDRAVKTTTYTVTAADLLSDGVFTSQDTIEYKLFTLPAGREILGFVTHVKEPFSIPSPGGVIFMNYVSAMQSNVQVSACSLSMRVFLTMLYYERRQPQDCQEHGFFDQDNPVDIVIRVQTENGSPLDVLENTGVVDFIVTTAQ